MSERTYTHRGTNTYGRHTRGQIHTWGQIPCRVYTRTNTHRGHIRTGGTHTLGHIHTGTHARTHRDARTHGEACTGKYTQGCIETNTMGGQRHMEGLYMDIYTWGDKYLHKEIYAWGGKYLQSHTRRQIYMGGYRHGGYMCGGDACKGDT